MHKSFDFVSIRTRLFWFFTTLVMVSCSISDVYHAMERIPEGNWKADQPVVFQVDVTDSVVPCNFYLQIRNNQEYPYSNLYLFLETTFPGGKNYTDTLECILSGKDGRWLGKKTGSLFENEFLIRQRVLLPVAGTYRFAFKHAMRHDELTGISAVGLRIAGWENDQKE